MNRLPLIIPFFAALCLASCETTGDPSKGGLFYFSPAKADRDMAERRDYLNAVQNDTAYQQGRTAALEQERAEKESQSNSVQ